MCLIFLSSLRLEVEIDSRYEVFVIRHYRTPKREGGPHGFPHLRFGLL